MSRLLDREIAEADEPAEAPGTDLVVPAAELVETSRRAAVWAAAVASAGVWALVALGEMIPAAVLGSSTMAVGLGVATLCRDRQVRDAGTAVAAMSLAAVAAITAPIADPAVRLAVVTAVLAPFVLGGGSDGSSQWWRRPKGNPRAVAATIATGLVLGWLASLAGAPALDAADATGGALVGLYLVVAASGVVEQVLYRGVLVDGLGRGPLAVVGAAALAGVVAAASGSLAVVAVAVVAGLVWGALRLISGSMWLPLLGHVAAQAVWMGFGG